MAKKKPKNVETPTQVDPVLSEEQVAEAAAVAAAEKLAQDEAAAKLLAEKEAAAPKTDEPVKILIVADDAVAPALNAALEHLVAGDSSTAERAGAQITLFNSIVRQLVRGEEKAVAPFMDSLLDFAETQINGIYDTTRALRGVHVLTQYGMVERNVSEFVSLTKLISDTANSGTRHATAKGINWEVFADNFNDSYSDLLVTRLKKYYNV